MSKQTDCFDPIRQSGQILAGRCEPVCLVEDDQRSALFVSEKAALEVVSVTLKD
jgi:hypothetical protein